MKTKLITVILALTCLVCTPHSFAGPFRSQMFNQTGTEQPVITVAKGRAIIIKCFTHRGGSAAANLNVNFGGVVQTVLGSTDVTSTSNQKDFVIAGSPTGPVIVTVNVPAGMTAFLSYELR